MAAGTSWLLATLLVVSAPVAVVHPSAIAQLAGGAQVELTLGANGSLTDTASATIANGSALRTAMDGNFVPFLQSLPLSNATIASITAAITAAEILSGLPITGNHDGSVEDSEASLFASLLVRESSLIPPALWLGSAAVTVTVDGAAPASLVLSTPTFSGATGSDSSSAPIFVTATYREVFPLGTGPHLIALGWGIVATTIDGGGRLHVIVVGPPSTSVDSTSGLTETAISNDPFGWAAPSASGSTTPAAGSTVTVRVVPAVPVGDLLVGAGAVIAGGAAALVLLRRRARRLRTPPPPPGVGAS